jgi:hypothetical protein
LKITTLETKLDILVWGKSLDFETKLGKSPRIIMGNTAVIKLRALKKESFDSQN